MIKLISGYIKVSSTNSGWFATILFFIIVYLFVITVCYRLFSYRGGRRHFRHITKKMADGKHMDHRYV